MTTLSTHDTKRGEDVRARIAVLAELPDLWADGARPACWRWHRCPTRRSATCSGRPSSAPGRFAGAAARLRREGDARGRRPHHLDRARRGVRARRARRRRRGVRRPARCAAVLDDARSRGSPGRAGATPCPPSWSRSRCPACPTSTRAASCGSRAWSTRTTADRSTSATPRGAAEVVAGERPVLDPRLDERGDAKLLVTQAALTLRRDQPRAVHDVRAVAGRRPGGRPRARLRPRWRAHRRHPAAGRARQHGGWGDTALSLPGGTWADLLTGREHAARRTAPRSSPTTPLRC